MSSLIQLEPVARTKGDEQEGYLHAEHVVKSSAFSFHVVIAWGYWPATASYRVDLTVVSPCCSEAYREKRYRQQTREGWISYRNVCKCCEKKLDEFLLPRDFDFVLLSNEGLTRPQEQIEHTLQSWVTRLGVDPFTAQVEGVELEDALLTYCVEAMEEWGWAEEIKAALGEFPER